MLHQKKIKIIGIFLFTCILLGIYICFSSIFAEDTDSNPKAVTLGYVLRVDQKAPNDDAVRSNNATYKTIQGALDSAIDGDTVEVAEGTYHESVIIRKSIHLKGAGMDKSILVSDYDAYSLILGNKVYATTTGLDDLSGTIVEGFTIQTTPKAFSEKGAIYLAAYSKNNNKITIKNNKILGNTNKKDFSGYGIYTPTISKKDNYLISNLYITHNTFENLKTAIYCNQLHDSLLDYNTITNTKLAAITMNSTEQVFQNISLQKNTITNASVDYKLSPTLCGAINLSHNLLNYKIEENVLKPAGGAAIMVKYLSQNKSPQNILIRRNIIEGTVEHYIKNNELDCSQNYFKNRSLVSKNVKTIPYYVDETLTKLSDDIYALTLSKDSLILNKGELFQLTSTIEAGPEANKEIKWESLDEKIATVDNGKVKAISKGTTAIIASAGSKKVICPVSVCVTNKTGDMIQIDAVIPDMIQPKITSDIMDLKNTTEMDSKTKQSEQVQQVSQESLKNPLDITIADSILNDIHATSPEKKIDMRLDLPNNTILANIENKQHLEDSIDTNIKIPDDIYRNPQVSLKELLLDSSIFSTAKEYGKSLHFNITDSTGMTLYDWEFDSDAIENNPKSVNLCLNIQEITASHRLQQEVKNNHAVSLDFQNSGTLPGAAKVKIFVGNQGFHSLEKVSLYYENKETKTLEYITSDITISQDLYATIAIDHCSSYILAKDLIPNAMNNPPLANLRVLLWIPIVIVILATILLYYRKQKGLS